MKRFSRREFCAATAATVGAGVPAHASSAAPAASAGLKDHAARAGILFGAAIASENFPLPECRALYEREVAIVTTDLALKFATLRPNRDVFNFAPADAIVAWANARGLLVRGHALIWNEYNGDWLDRCSAAEVERIFDEHIERVVSRYAGRIHTWDVVNEPFWPDHGAPGGFRRGPWYNALGPGYVARALKRVHAVDPSALLCVNEAYLNVDNHYGQAIRPCFARLIGDLRHAGVPLHAAGLQCHLEPGLPHDYPALARYCGDLARNKVDLHVTEFDVNDGGFPDAIGERDRLVAAEATNFLTPVLAVPEVTMLITWEIADKWSYIWHKVHDADPQATRLPRPLPFDDSLNRKPLWTALAQAFDARPKV